MDLRSESYRNPHVDERQPASTITNNEWLKYRMKEDTSEQESRHNKYSDTQRGLNRKRIKKKIDTWLRWLHNMGSHCYFSHMIVIWVSKGKSYGRARWTVIIPKRVSHYSTPSSTELWYLFPFNLTQFSHKRCSICHMVARDFPYFVKSLCLDWSVGFQFV